MQQVPHRHDWSSKKYLNCSRSLSNVLRHCRDKTLFTDGGSMNISELFDQMRGNNPKQYNMSGADFAAMLLCNPKQRFFVEIYMQWTPPLVKFAKMYSPYICDLDFCCYGESWRKPTRLMYNFLDISSLARRCSGTFLRGSNTKRPHIPLTGKDADGVYMTGRAQPYPLPLTTEFAQIAAQLLLRAPGSSLQ